jgi:uncharacterized protein (TIGR00730 family)
MDSMEDEESIYLLHGPITTTTRRREQLLEQIRDTIDRLEADEPGIGELKILARTLRELRYAFSVFDKYRGRRKITVFGSARTKPEAAAYQQGVEFGRRMAEQDWLVITGAGPGIMEAAHVGAGREHSMGLNIILPFEQGSNPVIAGDEKLIHLKYFFTRKLLFVKECDAICLLPGGFGTLDEGLETITLLQTGKRELVPMVFLDEPGGTFWKSLQRFIKNHLLSAHLISEEDRFLYRITDSVEEAVREVETFYKVYHSMRYVGDDLVFRLKEPPSNKLLADIREHFTSILLHGDFTLQEALPAERSEPEIAHLPRLVFAFDRRNFGKLRLLIDSLNAGRLVPSHPEWVPEIDDIPEM